MTVLAATAAAVAVGALLASSAAARPDGPYRIRTARVRLAAGRWEMLPSESRVEPFSGGALRLVRRTPSDAAPAVVVSLSPPGFPSVFPPPPHVETTEVRLGAAKGRGFPVAERSRRTAYGGGGATSGSGSSSEDTLPLGRVSAPDLEVNGFHSPDPFANEFTLAIVEEDRGPAPRWSLEEWQEALVRDLARTADEYDAVAATSGGYEAGQLLLDEQHTLVERAAIAMALPTPAAIRDLARLEDAARAHSLSRQAGALRLARFLAGDERVLEDPTWPAFARGVESGDLKYVAKPGGRFWARAAMLAPKERIRQEAWRVLEAVDLSAPVAGDLLDAVRAGRVAPPEWVLRRLAEGPTEDRSLRGSLQAHPVVAGGALALSLLGVVLAGLLLGRRSRAGSAGPLLVGLLLIGLLLVALDCTTDGWDLAPDALGLAFAALAVSRCFRDVPGAAARSAGIAFLAAAAASAAAAVSPASAIAFLGEVAAVATAAGVVLSASVACRAARRRLPGPFVLAYVLPTAALHALALFAFLGARVEVTVTGLAAVVLLGAVGLAALWAMDATLRVAARRPA